jgi:hypothetical protein
MPRLREEFDGDLVEGRQVAAQFPVSANSFEIPCSVCGRGLYVDEAMRLDYQRMMEYESDNNFTCFRCEQEYDDLAHP